ncbi:2'-5' RNA ligase family protein [Algoriphagus sp. D3-2-R+10]|uniref:2'-5' RNA ligase family protein n=1 Tax=Algoriphagus aurantiacus TaxID=3103948 RepID=UPI002B3FCBC6|nr:2'-5' RNA ligase family protein [Algoriphagus sp. D3-2-R+10]MEB2773735.1 2'-5' RNA ligase family protein [Algoriphagus sp. D3-2-R+10]
MKVMQKYFLAIVPEGEFQEQVTNLKLEIKELYQAKYALKSPAHITVKMPFVYNEAKEEKLTEKLGSFIKSYESMFITIKGVKTFGERVIYLGVEAGQDLYVFQKEMKTFCKKELNIVDELSDRNFHPHMTIAFKDIKKSQFQNILQFSSGMNLTEEMVVNKIALLKKVEGRWALYKRIEMR